MRTTALLTACALLVLLAATSGCGGAPKRVRPLRIAVTESGGDLSLTLEEPVREVECFARDYRRAPNDPSAVRPIWRARCTAGTDCRAAIRYADRSLVTIGGGGPLAPSEQGSCYECALTGDTGTGFVRFRMAPHGAFEPCRPGGGTL
jgi:hypothetical protein